MSLMRLCLLVISLDVTTIRASQNMCWILYLAVTYISGIIGMPTKWWGWEVSAMESNERGWIESISGISHPHGHHPSAINWWLLEVWPIDALHSYCRQNFPMITSAICHVTSTLSTTILSRLGIQRSMIDLEKCAPSSTTCPKVQKPLQSQPGSCCWWGYDKIPGEVFAETVHASETNKVQHRGMGPWR